MIADRKSTCEQARPYYYEYCEDLCAGAEEPVPAGILAHINTCEFCKGEVERLKVILAEGEASADEGAGRQVCITTDNLRLHFSYVGAFVKCDTVRAFLPSMVIPALAVRVPTPITVHVDKCEQCASDLERIRNLDLSGVQLYRLGQLFAEQAAADSGACAETRNFVEAGESSILEGPPAGTLRHLCACPECRELLKKYWDRMAEEFPESVERSWVPCDGVSRADVFDCVVPYGSEPGRQGHGSFRKSVMSHVMHCATCRDKMEQVRSAVYGIMEREESGVVTCYKVEDAAQVSAARGADESYKDWPIDVQVFDRSGRVRVESGEPAAANREYKQGVSKLRLRQFIKPAVAAAIVLAIGFFVVTGPAAKAFDLNQISKALGQIKNVCMIRSGGQETGPSTEVWVSRDLNIKMFKTGQECVLWDIRGKSRKSRDLVTGSVTTAAPDDDVLARIGGTMEAPWGLLPFDDVSNLPKGAEWKAAADEDVETTIPGTRIYDLTWAQKRPNGSMVYNKWRAYIDIETILLRRAEWWKRNAREEEYGLGMAVEVRYPSIGEVETAVGEEGF
ncbi:MAG: hypothetical protein ACYS4W_06145 [Planctomycetota bacterium]|jgi:hypothetical protein